MTGTSTQQQTKRRRRLTSKLRFLGGAAAVLAALTLTAGVVGKSFIHRSLPPAHAQQSYAPSTSSPQAKPADPFPVDDRGFINSPARCDGTQTATAVGRTQRSLVGICVDQNGKYQYRGVRISDGAPLELPAKTTGSGYLADNEGVTYAVSSTQLLVTSGETVINREPMIEYRQPRANAADTGAAPRPAATTAAPAQ